MNRSGAGGSTRKAAASLFSCCAIAMLAGCSSASTASSGPPVEASGTIHCDLQGSLTFDPALKAAGTDPERIGVDLRAVDCLASGGSGPEVAGGRVTATVDSATNDCALLSVLSPVDIQKPVELHVAWSPSSLLPSTVGFTGYVVGHNPLFHIELNMPDTKGGSQVTGSFPGSDKGAGSALFASFVFTTGQLDEECARSAGVSALEVSSGTLSLS